MGREPTTATGSGTTEILVLGPVEVRRDGADVDVGHTRQRAVLALLAAQPGTVATVGWLVEQLWQDKPPQRARDTLYSYLSRLRKSFAGTPVAIRRRSGGYVLDAAPAVVDMCRFRELVARARRLGTVADWDAALDLWRGEPFAELDVPLLDSLRATLDAEHFAAVLDRTDTLLRCGEHDRALPQLRELAERFPWDERLAGQLMLALYRCGRPSEALDHYRRLSTRLVTVRGTEPGADLARLHREILADDPGPRAASRPRADPVAGKPTPRQLPGDVLGFAGRRPQLDQLDRLRTRAHTIVVTGPAGVGKTSLAVHWSHRVIGHYPDGQLYVNLRGFDPSVEPTPAAEAILGLLDALGVSGDRIPATIEAQTAMYRTLAADRKLLILLDNARDAEQIRPLLPGDRGCLTVVTSRNLLAGLVATESARPVPLPVMSRTEARDLLTARLGTERVDAETDVVATLIRYCGGLPLALSIAAARAEVNPGSRLAPLFQPFTTPDAGLPALDPDDPKTSVRSVFSWSYRCLEPGAARLFRQLGAHPGPSISVTAAASLSAEPVAATRGQLDILWRAHLIDRDARGRYSLHDLLRGYARELAADTDTETTRRQATARLLDQYIHTARSAWMLWDNRTSGHPVPEPASGTVLDRLSTADEARDWFDTEEPVLVALALLAYRAGFDTRTHRLVRAMERPLEWRGRWVAWLACQHLALQAATRSGDVAAQAHVHMFLGHADIRRGDLSNGESHFQRSLDLCRTVGDVTGQAQAHVGLGMTYKRQGRYDLALEHEYHVCDLYESLGVENDPGFLFALNNLALTHSATGGHREALRCGRRALELGIRTGHHRAVATALSSLGSIHANCRDWPRAIDHYERAVAAMHDFGDAFAEANQLTALGDVLCESGDVDAAVSGYRRAVAIFDRLEPDGSVVSADVRAKLRRLEPDTATQPTPPETSRSST